MATPIGPRPETGRTPPSVADASAMPTVPTMPTGQALPAEARPAMTDPITAYGLSEQWRELGEVVSIDDADEILRRVERAGITDLYATALNQSVGIKRNRQRRREIRREQQQHRHPRQAYQ